MIQKNKRVNNEFYVCPVFNEAIEDGKKIKTFSLTNNINEINTDLSSGLYLLEFKNSKKKAFTKLIIQ